MTCGKIIVILTTISAVVVGYSVHSGGLFGNSVTEGLVAARSKVTDFFSGFNISAAKKSEIAEAWDNVSEVVEEYAAKYGAYSGGDFEISSMESDAKRNATELITSKGLLAEEHTVTTADGFILYMVRIKSPDAKPRHDSLPVFLLHGLLSSCDCFINNLRNESLGFILADDGFDVWLGNIRGNRYTTKHQTLQPTDKKFWKWSFDEMGQYDVPVMVNYVLSHTGFNKMNFIGHSEGTTNLITSVIRNGEPMVNQINKFIALAPAIYVKNAKGTMRALARFARIIKDISDPFMKGDVFAHNGFLADFAQNICGGIPRTCSIILHSMVGPGLNHYNTSRTLVYLSHAPAGTSTQNMVHWSQQCDDVGQRLLYYNYGGPIRNFEHYGQFHPPEYDISKFTVPTYAFLGDLDWLVTPTDGHALIRALPNVKYTKVYSDFNHIDFVWGYNVAKTVFNDILLILGD